MTYHRGLSTAPGVPDAFNIAPSLNGLYAPHGGRELNGDTPVSLRVVVEYGDSPQDTRAVILRSVRVGTSTGFIIALVDGTDRVADWRAVSLYGDLSRSRRAGNALVGRWGGPAAPPVSGYLPRNPIE